MSTPTPESLQNKITQFLETHGARLNHHVNFLHYVADETKKKEGKSEHAFAPASFFENQAISLQSLLTTLRESTQSPIDTSNFETRITLQEQFTKVIGTLDMIIDEHRDMSKTLQRRSSVKRLQHKYRQKHYLADDAPLEEKIQSRIRNIARVNQEELGMLTEEIITLSDAKDMLNEIRSELFNTRPPRAGGAGETLCR